jgi:dTDP-4-amino-4,6-dideoxy-D-glucose acyltransferase
MSYLTTSEIESMGFKSVGSNVRISRHATFYGTENISIGSNTRIDDFCVISSSKAGITIGDYVHIAVFCCLTGGSSIQLDDFSGISSRVAIYSSNDDYTGEFLTNPCVPVEFSGVQSSPVIIQKHVIVGTNSTILPGVTIHKGAAIGAYSLVNRDIEESTIAVGVPAKPVKKREQNIFDLEKSFASSINNLLPNQPISFGKMLL